MSQLSVSELTQKLTLSKARSTATETPISLLDQNSFKRTLGYIPTASAKALAAPPATAPAFAPAVDWHNLDGNHVTSVKNQASCGSCVYFCTVALTESMVSTEKNLLFDLFKADPHFHSSHRASCGGWNASDSFNQIKSRGVSVETCFPYATAFPNNDPNYYYNNAELPHPTYKVCADHAATLVKINGVHNFGNDVVTAKNYLTSTGPISSTFDVYDDS
jgi:C1A family cysteine protease